jgi:hypothetical protein
MTYRITLGDRVKDPISQAVGIAVVRSIWLNGCERIGVQPENLDKDGKLPDPLHFDESQLVIVDSGAHAPKLHNEYRPLGGPDRNESRNDRRVNISR